MSGIEVITEDLKNHPNCPHGPTVLFSRLINGKKRDFFACSACRDRAHCSFFLWKDEQHKVSNAKKDAWEQERKVFLKNINHCKLYGTFNEIRSLPENKRSYCHTCSQFLQGTDGHEGHKLAENLTDYQLSHPSEVLVPLDNAKKEAQFLFSRNTVEVLVDILSDLSYTDVICVGTPRLHEYIKSDCFPSMQSLLLDIDDRFHNFFPPADFCWYNSFNHHFFLPDKKSVFDKFLKLELKARSEKSLVLVIDPPFGGRIEPLAYVLNKINKQYKLVNNVKEDLPVFWIFPYFMEPQIQNSLPNYKMLDYKVDYDNHPLFQSKNSKGRKQGSPVRIFTNVDPSLIELPEEEGYKHCKLCNRWVAPENKHCKHCKACTSKDGRTYVHCNLCNRCVKPTWQHCKTCERCCQVDHKCLELKFEKDCFHCKKPGHKKRDCPEVEQGESDKRKKGFKSKMKKKQRVS